MLEATVAWWLTFYCIETNLTCQFFNENYGGRFNTEKECKDWAEKIGQWVYDISETKVEYACKEASLKHPFGLYVPPRRGGKP
jgi:hypothetical protein